MGQLTGQRGLELWSGSLRSAPVGQSTPDGQTKDRMSAVPKGNVRPLLTDSLGHVVSSHGGWGYCFCSHSVKGKIFQGDINIT